MQLAYQPRLNTYLVGCLLLAGCLGVILSGCAGSIPRDMPVHDDALSTVFLQNVSDKSFQAAHPIKLEETTVANVLRGVHTKEKTGLLLLLGKALKATNLSDIPTFSEEDVALLTPHITAALARATPNQRVGFRLYATPDIPPSARKPGQNRETTSGYLFADSLSLHFTLSEYRYMPGRTDKRNVEPRRLPDSDGLRDIEVRFLPEAAMRPESGSSGFLSGWLTDDPSDRTVVIDYQLLAKLLTPPPVAPPSPPVAPPVAQSLQPASTMSEQARKEDAELQAFKEELKALQKKLDEQKAELQELKKPLKKKKPAPLSLQ